MKNSATADVEPFLKWPGGKRWASGAIAELIRPELKGRYFEPFLGAGAVFLKLRPDAAVLSDLNTDLMRFLRICRSSPEAVVKATWRHSNTEECYYRIRASRPRSEIGFAARFLYLNRTCWGGIYRTNATGDFNVPFGGSDRQICSKESVLAVARCLKKASLEEGDFERTVASARAGDVIYADPPYTSKGQNNGFIRYNEKLFSWEDQCRLAKVASRARQRGVFTVISGSHHRDVMALYEGWWGIQMNRRSLVSRAVSARRDYSEVLLISRRPKSNAAEKLGAFRVSDTLLAGMRVEG